MPRGADRAIGALVDTLLAQMRARPAPDQQAGVRSYVLATVGRAPDYFRLALRILAIVFDLWSIPRHGRRFHQLDAAARIAQVERWRKARFGFQRSIITFYTTFTAFGLYSEAYQEDCGERGALAA